MTRKQITGKIHYGKRNHINLFVLSLCTGIPPQRFNVSSPQNKIFVFSTCCQTKRQQATAHILQQCCVCKTSSKCCWWAITQCHNRTAVTSHTVPKSAADAPLGCAWMDFFCSVWETLLSFLWKKGTKQLKKTPTPEQARCDVSVLCRYWNTQA